MTPEQQQAIAAAQARKQAIESARARRSNLNQARQNQNALGVLEDLESRGDLRPAEQEALTALRASSQADQDTIGRTGASYRGALQGATFRQADEVYGMFGGDKQGMRDANRAAQDAYPGTYNAAETGGAALTGIGIGLATAPISGGATVLGTAARGAGLGAVEGGLWGTGTGEGPEEKARLGAGYALIGGAVGASTPFAAKLAGSAGDLILGAMNKGNKSRANRSIAELLAKSGKSADEVAGEVAKAARQGQPEFRLMDALGTAGQRRASGLSRAGGDGAEEITEFLRQRQLDQRDRVSGFIDDAFQTRGTTAAKTVEGLTEKRSVVADALYRKAREGANPVDVRGAVGVIDSRIGGMQGSNIIGDGIDAKMAGFRRRLMADPAPNGEISRELSDFDRVLGVKQDVQDAIEAARRAGRNNEARVLGGLARELDAALEGSSDAYRFANDNFREASKVIEGVGTGRSMAERGRADDNISAILGMTNDQQRAARVGYGDKLLEDIEKKTAPTSNVAKALLSSKAKREAQALAKDPELLLDRITRENQMWETQHRALGGSRTADNLSDIEDIGIMADAGRAARDLGTGNSGGALSQLGGAAARVMSGQNDATRQLLIKALMSAKPKAALSMASKTARSSEARRAIVDALLRANATKNAGDLLFR